MSINKKKDKDVKPFKVCPEHGVLCKCGKAREIGTYPQITRSGIKMKM